MDACSSVHSHGHVTHCSWLKTKQAIIHTSLFINSFTRLVNIRFPTRNDLCAGERLPGPLATQNISNVLLDFVTIYQLRRNTGNARDGRRKRACGTDLPFCTGPPLSEPLLSFLCRFPSLGWSTCVFPPEMTLCAGGVLAKPGSLGLFRVTSPDQRASCYRDRAPRPQNCWRQLKFRS